MCGKVVFNNSFMLKYYLDQYKTQEMCDEAVGKILPGLKFFLDWLLQVR